MKKEFENSVIIDFKSQYEWDKCCELLQQYHGSKKGNTSWETGSAGLTTSSTIWFSCYQKDYDTHIPRITAAKFIASHEEKEQFPPLEDIDLLYAPAWLNELVINYIENLTDAEEYLIMKSAYENGVNITWKLKEKDPHAEIRAEYEQALADGKDVEVWSRPKGKEYFIRAYNPKWIKEREYKLKYFKRIECTKDEA